MPDRRERGRVGHEAVGARRHREIARGEASLIVAGYDLTHGIMGQAELSASVIMVLAATVATPPLLRLVFPRRHGPHVALEGSVASPPPDLRGPE